MKIIDKKGRLFGKISLIDIIIVACIAFISVVFVLNRTGKTQLPVSPDIEYSARIVAYNTNATVKAPFEVGDNVYSETGVLIGEISAVDAQKVVYTERLLDGTLKRIESEEYFDYYLTVVGTGTYTDKGYKAQGSFIICPNETVKVASKLYYGEVVVLSVEKND